MPSLPRPSASAPAPARAPARRAPGATLAAAVLLGGVVLGGLGACSPIVRPARFAGARDRVTEVTLEGPFDGQVVDETTAEPIQGATVVGVWSYDQGDGLHAPSGSEVVEVKTDQAGRYRIPHAPRHGGAARPLRMVSFQLVVYKRGYVGYRSDRPLDGTPRSDFAQRHNRASLRKWRDTDSHAQHLVFLAAPAAVAKLSAWEREAANVDLYRELGGQAAGPAPAAPGEPKATLQVLDAQRLLTPEDVRRRTGYTDAFEVKELGDLARTHFYHGVHLQAVDRDVVFEAVDLAAVPVAAHRQLDRAEAALVGASVEHVGGEQDHPGAGAEHRQAGRQPLGQRIEQTGGAEQARHRGALAARHHEGVDRGEIGRRADLAGQRAEIIEDALVRVERALQREHTDEGRGAGVHLGAAPPPRRSSHHPRSA